MPPRRCADGTVGPVSESIDYFSKGNRFRGVATKLALRARHQMFARFTRAVPTNTETTIIDIGVTPDRDLADSNFFEALYPYPARITATSIEDATFLEEQYPGLTFVRTAGSTLPFEDRAFDVAFCSAVLEHVGDGDHQRRFIAEMCRVADRFFLTTPNRWFPVELHTFLPLLHWLPGPTHQAVLRRLGKPFWASTDNLNLVSAAQLQAMFPPGTQIELIRHRTAGWCSNLVVHGRSPAR